MSKLFRAFRLPGALAGLLLAAGLTSGQAHAAYVVCRFDPAITLSNGDKVTLWANIQSSASTISAVDYRVHVAPGITIKAIQADQYGSLEHVSLVTDSRGNHVYDQTEVVLKSGSVPVTAYMSDNLGNGTAQVSGTSGQWITADSSNSQ